MGAETRFSKNREPRTADGAEGLCWWVQGCRGFSIISFGPVVDSYSDGVGRTWLALGGPSEDGWLRRLGASWSEGRHQ